MEFKNVLVYTDGRRACERGLHVGAEIARKAGGRLHVLHVAESLPWVKTFDPLLDEALRSEQEDELERLRALALRFGVEASAESRKGRAFAEIIWACHEYGCDLVVKTARGRERADWPMLGSTAHHVVRKCTVPVWIVGEQPVDIPAGVLALLASDPSTEERVRLDRRVLEVAIGLAAATGARLAVGAAWHAPGEGYLREHLSDTRVQAYVDRARQEAEAGVASALEPFARDIDRDSVHLLRGIPYEELAGLANARGDLAVVGTIPARPTSALLIREEAEEVINRLDTSFVAVKPEDFVWPPSL